MAGEAILPEKVSDRHCVLCGHPQYGHEDYLGKCTTRTTQYDSDHKQILPSVKCGCPMFSSKKDA